MKQLPEPSTGYGGSGFGGFVQGQRVTRVDQVRVEELLLEHCRRFNARNVVRVTQTRFIYDQGRKFYGCFVDPANTGIPRRWSQEEFCIWDFVIAQGDDEDDAKCDYWRAVPAAGPEVGQEADGVDNEAMAGA